MKRTTLGTIAAVALTVGLILIARAMQGDKAPWESVAGVGLTLAAVVALIAATAAGIAEKVRAKG